MGYFLALVLTVLLMAGGGFWWRHSGPVFTFPFPDAIHVIKGNSAPEQDFCFPNLFPGQLVSSFPVVPVLKTGDVVEIDMTSPMIVDSDDYSFRVQFRLNENVTSSYFFYLKGSFEELDSVKLRITSVDWKDATTLHQEDWFWLRQFYEAEVVTE